MSEKDALRVRRARDRLLRSDFWVIVCLVAALCIGLAYDIADRLRGVLR